MGKLISILLYPFSVLFDGITYLRNVLYDRNVLRKIDFELPVISIGNIRVGGTGKTPFTAFLVDVLKEKDFECATLSRGYGRKSTGFLEVKEESEIKSVGDEALMIKKRYRNFLGVYVCEDRAYAIPHILFERQETSVILLDDAFQHRRVERDLNILLTDYNHPFYEDCLMPSGRLRERRSAVKRSNCLVVTKCPVTTSIEEREVITKNIRKYSNSNTPIFFSSYQYLDPVPVSPGSTSCSKDIILFTGISDPSPLYHNLKSRHNIIDHVRFPDHHDFSKKDLNMLLKVYKNAKNNGISFVCTEKDMVRLLHPGISWFQKEVPVFYIPIAVSIIDERKEFISFILKKIENI